MVDRTADLLVEETDGFVDLGHRQTELGVQVPAVRETDRPATEHQSAVPLDEQCEIVRHEASGGIEWMERRVELVRPMRMMHDEVLGDQPTEFGRFLPHLRIEHGERNVSMLGHDRRLGGDRRITGLAPFEPVGRVQRTDAEAPPEHGVASMFGEGQVHRGTDDPSRRHGHDGTGRGAGRPGAGGDPRPTPRLASMLEVPAPTDDREVRADDLRTKREILAVFVRQPSARVLAVFAAVLILARLIVGDWSWHDGLVLAITIAITGTVEWIIHRFLLHAPEDAWTSRVLGTGSGHRQHHLDPPELKWLLLGGLDAFVFTLAFSAVIAGWVVPIMWITGGGLLGAFLTGWTLAALGLLHYEWVHLFVHTRYRPRSRYYARLARNHRLHHFRNERYWLGVTANSGDRLLRTYPRHKTDVPLSDTARTLGG